MNRPELLATVRVGDLGPPTREQRWLVHSLWPAGAVGIVGGAPKACKTWLGLDLALSVASATPCLGRFPVELPGPALAYLAEDSLERTHARLESMARARGLALQGLDLHLVREPLVRLDRERDVERLFATVEHLHPRLVLLDPFVRLHRINENDAGEVSSVLGELRRLQRVHDLAVVLVHHARKNGRLGPGEALRGSGDLYAWGDTYAHLQRTTNELRLTLEHRDERPIEPLALRLLCDPDDSAAHLEIVEQSVPTPETTLADDVLAALRAASRPLPRTALRDQLKIKNERLGHALAHLEREGRIRRQPEGWRAAE